MEKELKISELASVWNVSVTTTWNRIKKMGLRTFIKKSETNKDVNYVSISDAQLNEYIINVNNNQNKDVNNGFYVDMLSNNNVYKDDNNIIESQKTNYNNEITGDFIDKLMTVNNDYNNRLEHYNNELLKAYEELSTVKSKQLLLEDRASREGLYINEINELKKENNRNKVYIKVLITLITTLLLGLSIFITYVIAVNNIKKEEIKEPIQIEQPVQPAPAKVIKKK